MKKLTALVLAMVMLLSLFAPWAQAEEKPEEVTLRMLICWTGLSYLKPDDEVNNAVAQVIREKTGVTLEMEWINTTEVESLNLLFSTQNEMPDIVMAAYGPGAVVTSDILRQAANEGLLLPLDDLIDQYGPNLPDTKVVDVSQGMQAMLNDPEVGDGATFFLPIHTAATPEDMYNWGYTVYCRGDILEALEVDPASITTSEDVYELAKKIKAGNFVDTMGQPVIPASCWVNGWSYECFLNSFRYRTISGWMLDENGNITSPWFTDLVEKEALFMRKMINEGLYDVESFTQDDATSKAKYATGRVALTGAHWYHIDANTRDLELAHPEMEYVPLGPILDAKGEPKTGANIRLDGVEYTGCMMLTKHCSNPEAAIKYLNFLNTEEGQLLAYLGIEGEDWTYVDGVPQHTEEFLAASEADPRYGINRGIDSMFTFGCAKLRNSTFFHARNWKESQKNLDTVQEMYPLYIYEGTPLSYYQEDYPGYEDFRFALESIGFDLSQAYFAASDEAAIAMIERYRKALLSIGYEDYMNFLNEIFKNNPDVVL